MSSNNNNNDTSNDNSNNNHNTTPAPSNTTPISEPKYFIDGVQVDDLTSRNPITTDSGENASDDSIVREGEAEKQLDTLVKQIESGTAENTLVKTTNKSAVEPSALEAMAQAAADTGEAIKFVNDIKKDGKVETRFTIDPTKSTADSNISLTASYTSARAEKSRKNIEKVFSNDFTVLSLGQRSSFGQAITIATKLDKELDLDNLFIYSYNPKTGKISRIKTGYRIDKNGYLHFKTPVGYDIIISEGKLKK